MYQPGYAMMHTRNAISQQRNENLQPRNAILQQRNENLQLSAISDQLSEAMNRDICRIAFIWRQDNFTEHAVFLLNANSESLIASFRLVFNC